MSCLFGARMSGVFFFYREQRCVGSGGRGSNKTAVPLSSARTAVPLSSPLLGRMCSALSSVCCFSLNAIHAVSRFATLLKGNGSPGARLIYEGKLFCWVGFSLLPSS
eukprot:TRINITY_DN16521_c0_g1_i1.p1 TRINITY_DN16521_c0_g1~~TRINITY_DN16521_c0_g1_i1.p1  ORF type:complete len:107 (-),score=1.04 TRINITY_DN16521_c0_g1_i1:1064-1384(-)